MKTISDLQKEVRNKIESGLLTSDGAVEAFITDKVEEYALKYDLTVEEVEDIINEEWSQYYYDKD